MEMKASWRHVVLWCCVTTATITTSWATPVSTLASEPYQPGPHNTSHVHISALVTTGLHEELDIWVPGEPGKYPVLYFIDGFGGFVPASAYNELCHFIASHGVVVVAPWSITLPLSPVEKAQIFAGVLTWAEEHLEDKLHAKGVDPGVDLDLEHTVIGGHSAGGHVMVEYLKYGCGNVVAQVLLSPVDGVDPWGYVPEFCITPGEYLNFGLPTLHLMAGFDTFPAPSGISCAPDELSNMRFYNAFDPSVAPLWHINATAYGHADVLDEYFVDTAIEYGICGHNAELTPEDRAVYRRYIGWTVVSFIQAVFTDIEEDCSTYLKYLEDPSSMVIEVSSFHDNPTGSCPTPTCSWTPLPTTTPASTSTPLST